MSVTFNKPEKMAQRILEAGEKFQEVEDLAMAMKRDDFALRAYNLIEEIRKFREDVLAEGNDTQTFSRRKAA